MRPSSCFHVVTGRPFLAASFMHDCGFAMNVALTLKHLFSSNGGIKKVTNSAFAPVGLWTASTRRPFFLSESCLSLRHLQVCM